ncbi:MAG: GNAT family N-acetyltransferase [Lentisphaerae bacterium]|nr:GNAT family N-acetyltransferase [Lentisphaerota bacterium]
MLDKSVPYVGFIMKMRREKLNKLQVPELPDGYYFKFYEPGNENDWARLESLVDEFPSLEKALEYFNNEYRNPYSDELRRRCVFVCSADGTPVATATAWFMSSSLGMKSWLQWISCDTAHQGKGLGRAVIAKALSCYPDIAPESDVYLHTQTWSHTAMYLYWKLGFELFLGDAIKVAWHREPGFRVMTNDPLKALDTLQGVYTDELIGKMRQGAEAPTADELIEHELLSPFPAGYSY